MASIQMTAAPASGEGLVVEAIRMYEIILKGRETQRNQVDRKLNDPDFALDRTELRGRLIGCIRAQCGPGGALMKPGADIASTRAWLFYTLGRINDGDATAISLLEQHLNPDAEKDLWVRYWTLSGVARSRAGIGQELAKKVLRDPADEVRMVGVALLAQAGDDPSLEEIKSRLQNKDDGMRWPVLRALRVVIIDDDTVIRTLAAIINEGENSDITYDAIRAVQHISAESRFAREAANCLARFLDAWRTFSGRDSMRAQALIGLGKLKVETSAPVLVEELIDDNPAIVREAAYSLEKVLGTQTAVARVIEAASKSEPENLPAYARALGWMEEREAVASELAAAMSATESRQQEVGRALLSEMGGAAAFEKLRAQSNLMLQHLDFIKESEQNMQEMFKNSILDARSGFAASVRMDTAVFILGIALIIASATLQLIRRGDLAGWVESAATGAAGVLSILYSLLVAKPRQRVEEAVDHLMHLKIIFLGYLRQLHQIDQGYVRRLIEDKPLSAKDLQEYSAIINENMKAADRQLGIQAASAFLQPSSNVDSKQELKTQTATQLVK